MRALRTFTTLCLAATAFAACGGDDDDTTDPDPVEDNVDSNDGAGESSDAGDGALDDEESAAPAPPAGGGSGTAELTLANGETFEFSVLCALEPQMAAGSEILFSVTSYDEIGMDATQFGDDGTVTGIGTISVFDADYETLWEASSLYEAFGGAFELALDGSTVTGSGSFYPGADPAATPVDGDFVANC